MQYMKMQKTRKVYNACISTVLFILIRHIKIFSFCPFVDEYLSKINIGVEQPKHLLRKSVINYHFGKSLEIYHNFLVKGQLFCMFEDVSY